MKVINVHEAKTQLSKLLEQAKAGEEIIIGKYGEPYARLIPFNKGERPLGLLKEYLSEEACERLGEAMLEPTDEDTLAAWEAK
ncbi:MAG TPA: type II toxin-antitoxin system prevent-host-death family antitoxin [Trueperaceae bacterium]|nr:type II toxin-antitoxin system prevent-host-death family antitoxin [Trueperaceae bacterium]